MSYLQRWCNAMERSDLLKLVLSNVALDVLTGRVPRNIARSIFNGLTDVWEALAGAAVDSMDAFARRVLDEVLEHADDDSLCRGPSLDVGDVEISRVTDHVGVWMFNLDMSAFPSPAGGLPDEAFWILIEQDPLTPRHVKAGSLVRGTRPFAWITTRATIDAIREEYADDRPATQIRNYLGLDHFDVGAMLLELEYPPNVLATTRVAAPTFVEGGTKLVYQSVPSDANDPWGHAMRLDRIGDGGPEAVHMPIPFTHKFGLRYLGMVKEDPPPVDPAAYMTKRSHPWQSGDDARIAAEIEKEETQA